MTETSKTSVLLIEQSPALRQFFTSTLTAAGYQVTARDSLVGLEGWLDDARPDLILLDLGWTDPDQDPCAALRMLTARGTTKPPIVALVPERLTQLAVRWLGRGVDDYLTKPVDADRLVATLSHTLERTALARKLAELEQSELASGYGELMGRSLVMQAVYRSLPCIARSSAPVLVTGPRGSGKLATARTIHAAGGRVGNPCLVMDTASMTPAGQQSYLLGGGPSDAVGAIRRAAGGSLIIRNIDRLGAAGQESLLRFLQSGRLPGPVVATLGRVNTRVIATSSCDLSQLTDDGHFSIELFCKLCVMAVELPPLSAREGDIALLADHFLAQSTGECGFAALSEGALAMLETYHWPGNIAELKAVLSHITTNHRGALVKAAMVPAFQTGEFLRAGAEMEKEAFSKGDTLSPAPAMDEQWLTSSLSEIERQIIERRIRLHRDSIPKAAQSLGISASTIYRKKESWEAQDESVVKLQAIGA